MRPLTSGSSALSTETKNQVAPGAGGRGRGAGPRWRQNQVLGAGALNGLKDTGGQGWGTNGQKEEERKYPGVCLPKCELCKLQNQDPDGCLRKKRGNGPPHQCPELFRKLITQSFCVKCGVHRKLCTSPTAHASVTKPATFTGFLANKPARLTGHGPGGGRRQTTNVPILGPQHTSLTPQNKGQIGTATCLTSLITIKRGNDYVTVAALFDSGSELF